MAQRKPGRPSVYGFQELKVGDWKQFVGDDLQKIRKAALRYAVRHDRKFLTKIKDSVLSVKRIA